MAEVVSRVARKRAAKRAALIDVARRALAEGRTSISIQELTEEADMGFGSFYTHFPDKETLFDTVIVETMELHGRLVDELADGLTGMDAFALGVRLTCRLPPLQPEVIRLVIGLGTSMLLRDEGLVPRLRRDLRQGFQDGSFTGWTVDRALMAVAGAVLGTLQMLEADPQLDAAEVADDLCLHLLVMLGVPADVARRHAHEPLPEHDLLS
ncbi:TetR/AcrR family transcriptional regulator [Actinacidiphila acididurans]|uniref:TetR/AcrR family transcriptional regulator n=1 Tax=Actinacidiphila acididurans TaxID=2784346 RepID=A0ABS2TQ36_9ACTN|nr:TetR/AcrR family transcriptional regulator [Actinacidiphila acididurans]MBM9504380.1 TetR/AcrR family transcriptional regulator [Actinacidiphila acididurans]